MGGPGIDTYCLLASLEHDGPQTAYQLAMRFYCHESVVRALLAAEVFRKGGRLTCLRTGHYAIGDPAPLMVAG